VSDHRAKWKAQAQVTDGRWLTLTFKTWVACIKVPTRWRPIDFLALTARRAARTTRRWLTGTGHTTEKLQLAASSSPRLIPGSRT
jgi:hypothetical protein